MNEFSVEKTWFINIIRLTDSYRECDAASRQILNHLDQIATEKRESFWRSSIGGVTECK